MWCQGLGSPCPPWVPRSVFDELVAVDRRFVDDPLAALDDCVVLEVLQSVMVRCTETLLGEVLVGDYISSRRSCRDMPLWRYRLGLTWCGLHHKRRATVRVNLMFLNLST